MFNIKNLTKRIKNKKLKGNISLLVILVLLATSVITLLSINQIQRLITYWNQTFNYFRAYYLAKAWAELWLAEVYNRGDGFNNEIGNETSIVTWNLLPEYSAFNPYFKVTISWSFTTLTNDVRNPECEDWNEIVLNTGAWIMLSLFSDTTKWTDKILSEKFESIEPIDNWDIIDYLELGTSTPTINKLTFAFFTYIFDDSEDVKDYVMNDIIVETEKKPWDLHNFLSSSAIDLIKGANNDTKKYLTIKNSGTWNETIRFCITMDGKPIPYSNSLITSIWHFGDIEVWIQSIVKKWVPDWTLNVLWESTSN